MSELDSESQTLRCFKKIILIRESLSWSLTRTKDIKVFKRDDITLYT